MKFYLLLVMIVLVAGCASTKSVVGDQQLLSQSLELEKLSDQNKITVEMLMAFKEKLAGDPFAEDQYGLFATMNTSIVRIHLIFLHST